MDQRWAHVVLGAGLVGTLACSGKITSPANGAGLQLPAGAKVGVSGARRLSRDEYDNTVLDVAGDATREGFAILPEDTHDPFDNSYQTQLASQTLIEAAERLGIDVAGRLLADPTRLQSLLPCTPSGPADAQCLRRFITSFGRRALRRPLADAEVQEYLALQSFSVEKSDFKVAVGLIVQSMLQDPEFLYRVEVGQPVPGAAGVYRLSPFELATRLSYFLWGSAPPDWLLDLADQGKLASADGVRSAAARLLADPHAASRVDRFHALWLGFHQLPHPLALTQALRTETGALIQKVVFADRADYFQIFLANQTYVDDGLAQHYGIAGPGLGAGNFAWVSYAGSARKGILSHGAVLSAGAKFSDTSPTQRGIFVRSRLLCGDIPPPGPGVNVDQKPTSPTSNCKIDRYATHASTGNCASCHHNLDPIGFGLENYDTSGAYRTTDIGEPTCAISGNGEVAELGTFNGPAGLADLLTKSGQLERCVVTQVYRFAMGRREADTDGALITKLTERFKTTERHFDQLLLDFVADETFAFRRAEGT